MNNERIALRILRIKRVYETPEQTDGRRILVDRLWPRGVSKQKAKVDVWIKEIAPSTELRHWYGHDPDKWIEFKNRYIAELKANPEPVDAVLAEVREGIVTFIYSAKETRMNNAVVLRDYVASIMDDKTV